MKKLLLIATGGTIASDNGTTGLTPMLDAGALLTHVPKISEMSPYTVFVDGRRQYIV